MQNFPVKILGLYRPAAGIADYRIIQILKSSLNPGDWWEVAIKLSQSFDFLDPQKPSIHTQWRNLHKVNLNK